MRHGYLAIYVMSMYLIFFNGTAHSQPEPFYSGKTLQIIVGSASGEENDSRARLFARHFPKHIPGNPDIVVQNMPGAGGLRARNFLYNFAKPDGLTMAQIPRGTAFQEAIGHPEVRYRANRYGWLGNLTMGEAVCIVRVDRGGNNLKEAIKLAANDPLRSVVSETTSPGAALATLVKEFTGLNLKLVTSFVDGSAIDLSIERREADMRCGLVWSSAKKRHGDWFKRLGSKDPFAAVLVQIAEKRLRDLANVPTLIELAPNAEWRGVAEAMTYSFENAFPMLSPPGVPGELVGILRKAFWATVQDPAYIAEGKKLGFVDDEPRPGDLVEKTIKQILDLSEESKSRLRRLLGL